MKNTVAALRQIQEYWDSLPSDQRPSVRSVAAKAGMSYPTVSRYLNGTTKEGLPDKVRALAHALDRDDIMDEVVAPTPTINSDAWWIYEAQRVIREEYTEQIERERQLRKESEERFTELVSKLEADLVQTMKRKKLYEKIITGMVVFLVFYLLVFDLPHPKYGISSFIASLIK